jgi:alkanesulfonate monooxygenase SsuD/methylene tetrahydromethanopterin reductase-like flavin-dependent oxidoreductase (luciferase family)
MLRLTGRLGDGWLPSLGYLDLDDAHPSHRAIDEAAERAGRDPGAVRRVLNAGVDGPAGGWADQLARLAGYRFDTILVSVPGEDPVGFIRRLGEDAAPAARELVG